ncbi:hypothetical protein [Plastoroseomonas arctica]|uniref:Uncharacterized protein n=1 Tax=Plastoroseomonas arctica TaxID=1509237 RepID=A0AAF1JVI3_9PROT|nr:hypothetical protein [Plastoroseomonas arctica]MBR0654394.1 hypothetical protein [Plastoroseomonas arctica]
MRTFRLLAAAAEAEGLRLRRTGEAFGRRAALTAVAAVCGLGALIMIHIAGWYLLVVPLGPAGAAGGVALVDLVIAGLFLLLARPRFDPVAQEALMIRREMVRAAVGPGALGSTLWRPAVSVGSILTNILLARRRR